MKECLFNAQHNACCLENSLYFITYYVVISMCLKYGCNIIYRNAFNFHALFNIFKDKIDGKIYPFRSTVSLKM